MVNLGAQTTLHCYAYGYPNPTVTWWKEANMVNRSDIYQFGSDKSLIIKQAVIRSLGPYTCQAYNGLGRAASWTLTLQAVGPAQPLSPEEEPYRTYLIQPPEPEVTTLTPPTTSVSTLLTTTRKEFTGNRWWERGCTGFGCMRLWPSQRGFLRTKDVALVWGITCKCGVEKLIKHSGIDLTNL